MLKKLLTLSYEPLMAAALCGTSQAGVVFTDTFDHPGAITDFQAAGWTNIATGTGVGTEIYNGNPNQAAPESCMWGNGCSLEVYATNIVSCGDIISIAANCMRFEGYSYLREIVVWDGVNDASRVSVASLTDGHATGQYATWWQPPVKAPLATLSYNATPADAGKHLIFRYGHASGWGDTADVTFSVTPVSTPIITTQPKALVRTVGETATFSVATLGCGLTYQWSKNGAPISGATTNPLVLSPVSLANAGDYACGITNGSGGTSTVTVHLTVDPKLGGGASVSFALNFGDEAPWNPSVTTSAFGLHESRWNDSLPGSEAGPVSVTGLVFPLGAGQVSVDYSAKNTWSLSAAVPTTGNEAAVTYGYLDDGSPGYAVTLTGLTNSVGFTSYVVRLIAATDQSSNTNFLDATLTDLGTGSSQTLKYPGVTSITGGTMSVSPSSTPMSANILNISAPQGVSANNTRSTLAGFIITDKPVILKQPVAPPSYIFAGNPLSLSADAFGVPNLAYQWQKDGTNLSGATTSAYAKAVTTTNDSGVYVLVVTNDYGTAASVPVTVSVVAFFQPVITQQPVPATGYVGHRAMFTVAADGGQLTYQWQKGSSPISGATTSVLILSGLTALDEANYSCIVTNPAGTATSTAAHLTVSAVPTTGYFGAVLGDNPVSFWPLNETSGSLAFDVWGIHDGTYSGSVTLGVPGLIGDGGTAVNFTGGTVTVPYSLDLNPSALTIEFWSKAGNLNAAYVVAMQDRTTGSRIGYAIQRNNYTAGWDFTFGTGAASANTISSGTTVAVGAVDHVVATYDGTRANLFVNGVLCASLATPYQPASSSINLTIGSRNGSTAMNGVMDNVAVYNHALTPLQVKRHLLAVQSLTAAIGPVSGIVVNDKPTPPLHGQNFGATWAATESDGAKTRSGVMQFDATNGNQIVVSGYPQLDSTAGTICFWVRSITNAGSGSEAAIIMDRRDTGGGGSGTVVAINDNGTVFFQANPTGANPFSSASAINDGLWHHVAVTYGQNVSDYVYIYIDGTPNAASPNAKAWYWPSGMSVLLGKSRDAYWKKLHGSLDDVRFYNRVLLDTELAQVMTGAVVDANALVLRLDFAAAPVAGYRVTTAPVPATIQGFGAIGASYTPLGTSPYLHIPYGTNQFFRAVVP